MSEKISNHLRDAYRDKLRTSIIIFVFLSLIFLITTLIGSINGSVFLSKFTFSESVNKILRRNSITFTLLGFCIDDSCTQQLSHNFDKAPTSEEIQSGQVYKRNINIDLNGIGDSIGNTSQDVGNSLNNAAKDAGNAIQNVTNTAIGGIDKLAQEVIIAVLSAFDNFIPKVPTNGKSGWIARPIITASIFNSIALILLLITNSNTKIYCYLSTFVFLLISFVLNLVSFIITFSLFSLVFNVIDAFPGIGDNHTGPAMILSGCSCFFLFISLSLIIFYLKAYFYNFLLKS